METRNCIITKSNSVNHQHRDNVMKQSSKHEKMLHSLSHLSDKKGIRIKQELFLQHYLNCMFNISEAARKTGISREIVYYWKKNDPDFYERFQEATESLKDFVENALFRKIIEGDITAIIFGCKSLCGDRGYLPDRLLKLKAGK